VAHINETGRWTGGVGEDVRERELSDRLQAFFESKGLEKYGNRFTLDGNQLWREHSVGFGAMNARGGLASTQRGETVRCSLVGHAGPDRAGALL